MLRYGGLVPVRVNLWEQGYAHDENMMYWLPRAPYDIIYVCTKLMANICFQKHCTNDSVSTFVCCFTSSNI